MKCINLALGVTSGGVLRTWWLNFGLHKSWRIYTTDGRLLVSQEWMCSKELDMPTYISEFIYREQLLGKPTAVLPICEPETTECWTNQWQRTSFFFHWHYSPLWALACRTTSFHFSLSITNSLHLLTPSTWRSRSPSSFHPFLGLPLRLDSSSSSMKIFLGILSSSILSRWPNHLILCPFIRLVPTYSKVIISEWNVHRLQV